MILLLASAWASCDAQTDNASLMNGVEAAMKAFEAMEDTNFTVAREAVIAGVPCLGETIKPEVAAAVHRMRGLNAFLADDTETAQLYFAAARSIDPSYRFPESVAPEGHPLKDDYMALDAAADRKELMPEPVTGSFFVNGRRTRERSATYPIVFQYVDTEGEVMATRFLVAKAHLPVDASVISKPEPAPQPVAPAPQPVPLPQQTRRGPNAPLLVVAGVLGAAAGGMALANRVSYRAYNNTYDGLLTDPNADDLQRYDRQRGATNALGFAATGAGIAAVGLGVTGFVVNGRF